MKNLITAAFVIASTLLVSVAAPAQAQVVTLQCTLHVDFSYTFDIDLGNRTFFVAAGNWGHPTRTYRADISDRYIQWSVSNEACGTSRIDRRSGVVQCWTSNVSHVWNWGDIGSCRRAGGDILKD